MGGIAGFYTRADVPVQFCSEITWGVSKLEFWGNRKKKGADNLGAAFLGTPLSKRPCSTSQAKRQADPEHAWSTALWAIVSWRVKPDLDLPKRYGGMMAAGPPKWCLSFWFHTLKPANMCKRKEEKAVNFDRGSFPGHLAWDLGPPLFGGSLPPPKK